MSKSFADLNVLRQVDLRVERGDVVTLIGPSGSGKSTLLRCLNLLEVPDSGELLWEGSPIDYGREGEAALSSYRRQVGMVFQHFHLFPHLSALDNVMEGPRQVLGRGREQAASEASALLARVGLATKERAFPNQLSGGQKQRVAIARALALQPTALLLDEATSALDIEMVAEVNDLLRDLAQSMTMVVVTHDLNFAGQVSDRVGFMAGGQMLEVGRPEQVLQDPQHPRTREFLKAVAATA